MRGLTRAASELAVSLGGRVRRRGSRAQGLQGSPESWWGRGVGGGGGGDGGGEGHR